MIFFWLLLIHLLYDWHWQGDFVGTMKGKSFLIMFVHCLTWGMLMVLPIIWYVTPHLSGLEIFFAIAYLVINHMVTDMWKCRLPQHMRLKDVYLFADQMLHVFAVLLLLAAMHVGGHRFF